MAEDGYVGFEERLSWLPFLDESCNSYTKEQYFRHQRHQQQCRRLGLPVEPPPQLHPKSSLKPLHRPRFPSKWTSGGPGMQAVFLRSGQRSSGTGVFLPRWAGMDVQPSKKPACSPVLLPSRVVQALNLNVHTLGTHVTPLQDHKNYPKGGDRNLVSGRRSKDISSQCRGVLPDRSSSPEIFLPKEWTY